MVQEQLLLALYRAPAGTPSVMLPAASDSSVLSAHSCGTDRSLLHARLTGPGQPQTLSMLCISVHRTKLSSDASAHVNAGVEKLLASATAACH